MGANTFGRIFCVTSFGESHGKAMGVVIDGMPAGVRVDSTLLTEELTRRKPGSPGTSQRQEDDKPEILSGVFDNTTLGTPIAVTVLNSDARSDDYRLIQDKKTIRTGHADKVWEEKFGIADLRGGGRASGRETVARVIAGAFAKMYFRHVLPKIAFETTLLQIGKLQCSERLQNQVLSKEIALELKTSRCGRKCRSKTQVSC